MPDESTRGDGDSIAVWLFAHDLSDYAGEWIAASASGIVAHNQSLRELREAVSAMSGVGSVRFYAVPGEIQTT